MTDLLRSAGIVPARHRCRAKSRLTTRRQMPTLGRIRAISAGALRHRDFRLFWSGQLVSLIGTWMQSVGQAWLVLELTNSPFRLGLLGTLQYGPMLLFAFL